MKRRLVAEDGAAYVRERLSRENPKQVIPQLQEEHGLADPDTLLLSPWCPSYLSR